MDETFHFLFVAHERTWSTDVGSPKPPLQRYFEVRSLPGNLVGAGATVDEAEASLVRSLGLAAERAGSASQWYNTAMERLKRNASDRALFEKCGGKALLERKLRPFEMRNRLEKAERALMRDDCGELAFAP